MTDKNVGWERVWNLIAHTFGSFDCLENNEVWQYMGTTEREHQFRHRSFRGQRKYHNIAIDPHDFDTPPEEPAPTLWERLEEPLF
jgi:hypothetical protein